jgi:hypothetical protein
LGSTKQGLLKKPNRLRRRLLQRSIVDKLGSIRTIRNCYKQLSIEEFHVPFAGTLDPENRWVIFSSLLPWEELEATYSPLV